MPLFSNLKLTSKTVFLVMLLGALAVIITLYSMTNLYRVDRDYRALLDRDAKASLLISSALLDLSDASKLVLSVLTEQEVAEMRKTQALLKAQQTRFNGKIRGLAPLIDNVDSKLEVIQDKEQKVFALADAIINSAARWRGDKALDIIHKEFDPQLNSMRSDMDKLMGDTIAHFENDSRELSITTQSTLFNTTLLFGLALVAIIGLSAYLSFTQISRPIKQLTKAMERLSRRDFQQRIYHTERRDEVGKMAQALEVFRDNMLRVDHLEVEAEASARAREMAEQVAQAKANFLATMSHEIRTPMNAILGLAQLSLRHPLEPQQKDRIEKIMRTGKHLLGIINDILDYSKLDSGHVIAEAIPFSPMQLLADTREMLDEVAKSKGIRLQEEATGCPALLVGDPMRIRQILLNYANNALKFSDHGQICLRLSLQQQPGDSLYLYGEVEDQGIGLDETQIQQLFQPFHQADSSITRRFGGTGLGLAICRNLAELMGGSTGAHSVRGQGSTFWFRVKVRLPETSDTLQTKEQNPEKPFVCTSSLQGLHVLLVDDNDLNRLVASELLMGAGIDVDEACDGRSAIEILESSPDDTYTAILMDMMMPGLDGVSATRQLRMNPRFKNIPIIAMTANVSERDVATCLAAGMNAHISKPIDEQDLLRSLAEHCLSAQVSTKADVTSLAETKKYQGFVLDPGPLEHLKSLVSRERFDDMIDMLIEDCKQRGQSFRSLTRQTEPHHIIQQGHDLIGTAGHVGLNQLRDLGKAITEAARDADTQAVQQLALEINRATLEAIQELQRHFKSQ
ncbi:ATP-binding protein [Marinobacter sp. F3R11]|uniref:ATP-binding protein n=1 Tax=Marinobacter sp. F3R11 TaxID=2267231 RepID=UPI001651218E|nr:ATP-binding protein [Marinobacter sp. F3R11]